MSTTGAAATVRSQRERTQASRQRILDSAVRCLVEHGYAGASTLRIQEMAGVSRGRLLHHFPSRDELLVAAAHHLAAGRVAAVREESALTITAAEDDPNRLDQAIEHMWTNFHQPYFWAAIELWIAARHKEELRLALRPNERKLYRTIKDIIAAMFGPVFAAHPLYPQLRDMLVTSMRGVSVTYSFDRRRSLARDPHLLQWKEITRATLASTAPGNGKPPGPASR